MDENNPGELRVFPTGVTAKRRGASQPIGDGG
jgi:hypothetical protein